jgi:predicted transport protein
MALTPKEMTKAILTNLPKKTGKTLQEWLELLASQGPAGKQERVAWLKSAHGLGTFQAQAIVQEAEGGSEYTTKSGNELIDEQFAGRKESLRPILDEVLRVVRKLGRDVRVEPCKTYVPVMRKRQFAVIRATAKRVDLGLALPGVKASGRLQPARKIGSAGRINYRIPIANIGEVDDEVEKWLRRAYELDAR